MTDVFLQRIYDVKPSVGKRILVDRLWPRGISKERAQLDLWLPDAAPSPTLRKWFCHDAERFAEFAEQYRQELQTRPETGQALAAILQELATDDVTLLYGAKDSQINHAVVLWDVVKSRWAAAE